MKTLDLNFICATLNLPQPAENHPVCRVITDSRQAQEGDLFVALAGENHDAHDFVPDVLAKGARAIVSRSDLAGVAGCFFVPDTLHALQQMAAAWRKAVNPFVFGITGSSGKTTVKEMLAAVLRAKFGADAVLAAYHDQGLPVLKYAAFGKGVNITLGLPFVRTSVDHGTALDLAGTGKARSGSLHAAVLAAFEMAGG